MSTVKTYTAGGEAAAEMQIDDARLTLDRGDQAVKDVVTAIRNAKRAGTADTLAKGEVSGSNKKPWKQKGTGNARSGFRQSPVWRGGGVAHGPHPRSFAQKINRKVAKLAFARALSGKIADGEVAVVEEFRFAEPKTKLMAALLKKIGADRSVAVVTARPDAIVSRVCSNLPRVTVSTAASMDVYTLLASRLVLTDKAGFEALSARLAVVKEG